MACEKTEKEAGSKDISSRSYADYISTLPKREGWAKPIILYGNFWFKPDLVENVMLVQTHFKPCADDILLIAHPKCGTTWLKALGFAIINRSRYTFTEHPLLTRHPQECVPYLEIPSRGENILTNLDLLPSPRLLSSHMPLSVLPPSVFDLGCQVVYLCRDPKDAFVSRWHFENHVREEFFVELDKAFDMFCMGVSPYGPIWNHYLEYWKESLARPEKVLFLKYENMMRDPINDVKRLAKFLAFPFTEEEEKNGIVEEIVRLCSFETLKGLKINQTGVVERQGVQHANSMFFRTGKVGDWVNHLSDEMGKKLDSIVEEKLQGSGLTF